MSAQQFEVFISGSTSSVEEWKRALEAPREELPELDSEQREFAKRFKISNEEYARGVLAGRFGEARQKIRGQKLGEWVTSLLQGFGESYKLVAVLREGVKFRWVLRIDTPQGVRNVAVPLDLADDVIDSGLADVLEELKQRLLAGVGRSEQIGGRQ
jgi:hypothetical protein